MDISLPGLLQAYPTETIAKAVKLDPDAVRAWRRGTQFPLPQRLPVLAKLLKIPLIELGEIIARDRKRYKEARRATRGK